MSEEYKNDKVTVNFPDKMEVDAPKTDYMIDSLTQAFVSLSKMLQKAFVEILDALQTLKHVPEIVDNFQKEVTNQFTNMFTHQLESQIMSRQASMLSAQKKWEITDSRCKEKTDQLSNDIKRLTERYGQKFETLTDESKRRINDIDSHAFDVVEGIYPKQIQEKFSFDSVPAVELLAAHADDSAVARALCLEEGLESLHISIRNFLEKRESFYKELDFIKAEDKLSPGWYELPFLVAEVEDTSTGEITHELTLDPALLDKVSISDEMMERLNEIVIQQIKSHERETLDPEDQTNLAELMSEFEVPEDEQRRFEEYQVELITTREVAK